MRGGQARVISDYTSDAGVAVIEAEQPRLWFARAAKLLRLRHLRVEFMLRQ